ncbi:unnamed protein product [Allacma fusca]|uniref:Uncharacterized protein n=1 Tax=Allacma fusca TaxID=39272 RepID=A0A8J2KYL9_9HEXA|nr:unnamed protein product [Allacma fusca]
MLYEERSGPSSTSSWGLKEENLGAPTLGLAQGPPPTGFLEFPAEASSSSKETIGLSKVSRQNPQILAYAQQAYGTTDLDEEQWKQCEEAYKLKLVYQDIAKKKARDEKLEAAGKFKWISKYQQEVVINESGHHVVEKCLFEGIVF